MNFYKIKEQVVKKDTIIIKPDFIVTRNMDLMVRGKKFYAVWDEEIGLWNKDEYAVQKIVDKELREYYEKCRSRNTDATYILKTMNEFSSGSWEEYTKYVGKVPDTSHQLDAKIIFADTPVSKKDYASKRLPYSMKEGSFTAYEKLISTLYSDKEREKIEWAIGAIISGDAKRIQKFIVLYGSGGTGKSTVLNIISMLFEGYCTNFDAKELASANNQHATGGMFSGDPLVAIQHDGDLSNIKDNSKLNSIISHEMMQVNEKFKPQYTTKSNAFLFMGTNKPVKITDAKSGIIRRLIEVTPSGMKVPETEYNKLMKQIKFELGAIAYHCLEVYKKLGEDYYNNYRPMDMMYKTDMFFNFVQDSYPIFNSQNGITLKAAYALYKEYCEDSGFSFILPKYEFREELKNYFEGYKEEYRTEDGKHVSNYFVKFREKMFKRELEPIQEEPAPISLVLNCTESIFDKERADLPAQYASDYETPKQSWSKVKTKLSDLDTHQLHYVKLPENHIVVDFDLKDENGEKSFEKNIEAASVFPPTYAEASKSGAGVHLHYIYDGDVNTLSRIYSEGIEVKVFNGNSSLRRKLTKCNNLPIAHISDGLPLKGEKMIDFKVLTNEKAIRTIIIRNLNKEYHASTKSSCDFINDTLNKAYDSGMKYDVTDLRNAVYEFAMNSTNQSDYCMKLVGKMKFKSDEVSEPIKDKDYDDKVAFFDVEVFPNLFVLCWKLEGPDHEVVKMINPSPVDVENLFKCKLIGFNNRKYDNHILYAASMGYPIEQLYKLSQNIIQEKKGFFGEAYNISYSDIYDFASAGNKKSLKKWEIELGLTHIENSYPWDKPVPEDKWEEIADYCANDVNATEAVFHHLKGDWVARQILAEWAGMTCNDTTNNLSARIIFGKDKHPQHEFNYRDLSKPVRPEDVDFSRFRKNKVWRIFDNNGEPTYTIWERGMELPVGYSIMPFFPGYVFDEFKRHSSYKDVETVGEGGYVYSEPSMNEYSETYDIASEHPSSVDEEELFGPEYTENFRQIKNGRLSIKHKEFDEAKRILPNIVHKYLDDKDSSKGLSNAMKTVINAVYGQTSATYDCVFKDPRNKDNIVAKRGALFMINLRLRVQEMGYKVLHCKTDSIKIVNPDKRIKNFIFRYGLEYGYTFEVEHTFDKICLVDKANYIALLSKDDTEWKEECDYCIKKDKPIPTRWVATGDKFKQPYIFKTLFDRNSKIAVDDLSEVKSVKTALYLDMNEGLPQGTHNYMFVGRVGQFTPVKEGTGGGELVRLSGYDSNGNPTYAYAEGCKGWRWKETEIIKSLKLEDQINMDYWNKKVDDAIATISEYGDFEKFVADDEEFTAMNKPVEE